MNRNDKIYVAGHRGMVGSALVRQLKKRGFENLVLRTSKELDLRNQSAVKHFLETEKPDIAILAAARVGGIQANIDHPAEFLYENLAMQNNVIHFCHVNKVKQFCFLASSCIYPRECPQPMKEEYLLTGPLEPTNEGYAMAKLAGIKMVEFYRRQHGFPGISVVPCNLYGTNDHFDPVNSHVLSSLVRKFVDAVDNGDKEVPMWGTGIARREFMHVDDAAEATLFVMEHYTGSEPINLGVGSDITIKDLALLIAEKAGFRGKLVWDPSKPDGMLRKCMDVSRMKNMGFAPKISLEQGVEMIIGEYRDLKRSKGAQS